MQYEQMQQIKQHESTGRTVQRAVEKVPGLISEFMIGGAGLKAGELPDLHRQWVAGELEGKDRERYITAQEKLARAWENLFGGRG